MLNKNDYVSKADQMIKDGITEDKYIETWQHIMSLKRIPRFSLFSSTS